MMENPLLLPLGKGDFNERGVNGMKRVKKRTFSGAVLEQEIYSISDRAHPKTGSPRLRFKSEEERVLHREGISRRHHARIVNENYSHSSIYGTLTFSDDAEVHTFSEAKKIKTAFLRRLRYKFPEAKINLYMGRGKHTSRIHFHFLSDGIPEEYIKKQWIYGDIVHMVHLREHNFYDGVDCGRDYTGLANYLFDHWTNEQGGKRWTQTRTVKSPESEAPKEIKRNYSLQNPPKAPKGYILTDVKETGFGYLYFKFVRADEGVQLRI